RLDPVNLSAPVARTRPTGRYTLNRQLAWKAPFILQDRDGFPRHTDSPTQLNSRFIAEASPRMRFLRWIALATAATLFRPALADGALNRISRELGKANVRTEGNDLIVDTGAVRGRWRWTGHGLVTVGLRNDATGKEWAAAPRFAADWDLGGLGGEEAEARLIDLSAAPSADEGFTSEHVEVVAEIEYPAAHVRAQHVIWAYPGAPGLRTQLRLKALDGFDADRSFDANAARIDYLPLNFQGASRRAAGYHNNSDARNGRQFSILRDETQAAPLSSSETYDWASLLFIEQGDEGVAFVKESQKCVNNPGVNTGAFQCGDAGLVSTGWGLSFADVRPDASRPCWASWRILWNGGDAERELALKRFDRLRYPIDPKYDIYLMANPWGGGRQFQADLEDEAIKEIRSCADLGIDVAQIDAGWANGPHVKSLPPWAPWPERYPDGWKNLMAAAKEAGVAMGLWTAARWLMESPDDLTSNYDAGFRYFKVDITPWDTYEKLYNLTTHARQFELHTNHVGRVNWDITHKDIRVGYYFAREYGNLFLENRRLPTANQKNRAWNSYTPFLVLRDAWHVSQYVNLNKVQIDIMNTDLVDPKTSNAKAYGNSYAFAIAMMSSPLFFQETKFYSEEARAQLRPLIALYKKHRQQMAQGYVFPIGDEPDDASWTGFQTYNPETQSGYLTLFREIDNAETTRRVPLRFLDGKKIQVEDLVTKDNHAIEVDAAGKADFQMDKPASFRFYRYSSE
ncbi:MAG: hypothetical protein NTW86_27965, partial [Candidatus Sumerlaeota bacterium]|nr:hypothetical protein [Candidatus Sumerlaeota bacterium]